MPSVMDLTELQSIGHRFELQLMAATTPAELREDGVRLAKWQEAGFAAQMSYMNRPSETLSNPLSLLSDAKSILTFALQYESKDPGATPLGHGRVARYAWGIDYHTVLPARIKRLASFLEESFPSFRYRVFSDAVPLLERALGRESGLGFVGKNTMLIRPGFGSFFFLAELISNLEIRLDHSRPSLRVLGDNCGSCKRCLDHCPTKAIISERVLDASRCISYLSIEKRGVLSASESQALGEWIFGCDVCQDVCPFNHTAIKASVEPEIAEFRQSSGVGPFLSLMQILSLRKKEEFNALFGRTAITRTGRVGLLRNAAAVAANTNDSSSIEPLLLCLKEDPSPVVRAQSLRALADLAKHGDNQPLLRALDLAKSDRDPLVNSVYTELC